MLTVALQQLPLWNQGADDGESGWRVRRSGRARRLGVRVFRDGTVEIVVPARTGPQQVQRFVARHRSWIERQRRRALPADLSFPPDFLQLRALGETWRCRVLPGDRPTLAERAAGPGGGVLELAGDANVAVLRAALLDWLLARANETLKPQLRSLAERLGAQVQGVQIRCQRTRWGSCSVRGTISLNGCLLFHRPEVVCYLYKHELAHLAHMNHSARFWDLLRQFEPQWRELDRELARGWNQVPGWLLAHLRA